VSERIGLTKNISKYFLIFVLLLSNIPMLFAQLNATLYEDFTLTNLNPYLINPSASDSTYLLKVRLNNINGIGITRNVRRFYLDLDKRIGSRKNNGYHFLGLQVTNIKLGDYISKSRLQMRYSWYAKLSKRASISSGVSLGFINYSFLTTQGGTGGTDLGPDGAVGIHYLRQKSSIGFAIQQIFGTVLIPINQSFSLQRLYNVDFTRKFQISPNLDFSSQFVLQVPESGQLYAYGVNLHADLLNTVYLGASNYSLRKTSASVGVKRVVIFDSTFFLVVTYNMYHSQIPLPDNTVEVFLGFDM